MSECNNFCMNHATGSLFPSIYNGTRDSQCNVKRARVSSSGTTTIGVQCCPSHLYSLLAVMNDGLAPLPQPELPSRRALPAFSESTKDQMSHHNSILLYRIPYLRFKPISCLLQHLLAGLVPLENHRLHPNDIAPILETPLSKSRHHRRRDPLSPMVLPEPVAQLERSMVDIALRFQADCADEDVVGGAADGEVGHGRGGSSNADPIGRVGVAVRVWKGVAHPFCY